MPRLLILLLLAYIGFRIIKALISKKDPVLPPQRHDSEETVQDPVCKMYLAKKDAVIGTLDGTRHYFCSMNCLEKFRDKLDHTNNP
jgi:YHS domain-containing protein